MQQTSQPLEVNDAGHLVIGGVDSLELANQYQTPLVAYDVTKIRDQIHRFQQVFEAAGVDYAVSFASKALAIKAIYQVMKAEGVHADVVSGGELYTAQSAGFPMAKVSYHGNNKSKQELSEALDAGVGMIVIDNFHEIDLLKELLAKRNQKQAVMLRLTPGITAHTNEYIQTGQVDSKFGFDLASRQADRALQLVLADDHFDVRGIHAHIGSQIFDVQGFAGVAKKLVAVAKHFQTEFAYVPAIINVGGGFGIRYVSADHPQAPEAFVKTIVDEIKTATEEADLPMPAIWIEPGRSLVGPAGYNLYTVGSRKDIPGFKPFVSVDGGMGDNIRPALYQAEYETVLARDPKAKAVETVRIAGKYCESGDILSQGQPLPATQPGDVLAMLATGAYGYSMASNYNRNPRPAVVFAENGKSYLVVKRESYAELVQNDQDYPNA